jgi:RNA 3'-terminal phosphate cyclase (ATP)
MQNPICIDGSIGEGGGQILRSALALSMVTGQPFRIEKIRAGRDKPGLLRQHLTAVQAATAICGAEVEGAGIGSQQLGFSPGPVRPDEYSFAVGTAGSTTLVLQTILPALLCASGPSTVTLEGGTHNPFAPPFDFLQRCFLPLIARMGPKVYLALERPGFYPAGGGRFTASIEPSAQLVPLHLPARGEIRRRSCTATVANLPREIAEREAATVRKALNWPEEYVQIQDMPRHGPGNILMIELESEHVTEVFTGFGQRGVHAAAVADDAVQQTKQYLAANVPVGRYLADQLLLPLALAGGGSFPTLPLTRHSTTNIGIIQLFLDVNISVEHVGHDQWHVTVAPHP